MRSVSELFVRMVTSPDTGTERAAAIIKINRNLLKDVQRKVSLLTLSDYVCVFSLETSK